MRLPASLLGLASLDPEIQAILHRGLTTLVRISTDNSVNLATTVLEFADSRNPAAA